MCPRTTAVLLLLVLQACAHRTDGNADFTNQFRKFNAVLDRDNCNKHNPSEEVRARRHDGEERPSSGRRWTTSRNSPYQKIVSSYEQEVPEEQQMEDPAQAKAKTQKRKQWRTSAASHDQIGSETSSDDKVSTAEPTDSEAPRGKPAVPSRRRSASSHSRENEEPADQISSVPKKRRGRPATISTTTPAPQTMSDSLYQYFRPLERDVPQDDIIPFLDFGRKLAPVIPTPSGANSIEGRSRITKLRSRHHHEDRVSHLPDDEMLQEDMDVTVVKTAIERNSVPRAKLRVREQGISDFYRKRVPPQVRTTENLISTSDSSTASSVPGFKSNLSHKKLHRHQIHNEAPLKSQEHMSHAVLTEVETPHQLKSVEYIPEKRRQMLRPVQKLAPIKLESSQSPLTAESTVVKTIIKDPSITQSKEENVKDEAAVSDLNLNTKPSEYPPINNTGDLKSTLSPDKDPKPIQQANENEKPKILSTAVVTSVSVQESLDGSKQHVATEPPVETTTNKTTNNPTTTSDQLSLASGNKSMSSARPPFRSFMPSSNFTNSTANNLDVAVTTNRPIGGVRSQTSRTETPLRSRDIYRPKAIVPGGPIPHLPRQIPTGRPANVSGTTNTPQEVKSSTASLETSTIKSARSPSSIERTTSTTQMPSTSTTTDATPPPTAVARTTTALPQPQSITTTNPSPTTTPPALSNHRSEVTTIRNENVTAVPPTTELAFIEKKEGIVKEPSSAEKLQPPIENVEDIPLPNEPHFVEYPSSHTTESESVPPPKQYEEPTENLTFVPIESSYPKEDHVDPFPIYFTTLPTATIPVVDTRPETEAAVVEEQKNTTTPRPLPDWVKIGAVEKDVEVVYPEPLGLGGYALAALGVIPIVLGALIAARFILAHSKKKVLDESEYSSEYNRSPLGINASTPMPTKLPRITTHVSWSEMEKSTGPVSSTTSATSPSARWEFQRDKLRLQTLLGEGNFGQVWKAEADDIAGHEGLTRLVAVKTVKESATNREREDLLRELGIMQELGSHPNVVTLLGCCTEKEPIYLIMEYVMYGKLLSFLRDHRTRAHYYNFSDATDALTSRDLTVFAYCVARGMDYLTNKSIIHRDLAARNVLVDHNKLCKIADFGMSRNVRDTGQIYEQRQSKGALPIRWMAPESLHFSLFTHKTDVWSFGILMWEIVTLGSTPYATMGAREVMRRVRDGYRLDRPGHCRPELFRVITQCWHSEPSKRPTFAELKVELGALLNDTQLRGSFVDLDSYADEMRRDSLHRH